VNQEARKPVTITALLGDLRAGVQRNWIATGKFSKLPSRQPGKVRRARVYALKPGMAHLYNEGDVHSPKRLSTTGLIRIEGKNTQKMKRLAYKAV
jgi:hypothetical protein